MTSVAQAQPRVAEIDRLYVGLELLLTENIVPFWYPQVVDIHGGYRLNHDGAGQWRGPADKILVTQAQTLWFFFCCYNDGYGGLEYLEATRHDFEFLRNRMWDLVFGGFFGAVDAAGEVATRPHKHLYA